MSDVGATFAGGPRAHRTTAGTSGGVLIVLTRLWVLPLAGAAALGLAGPILGPALGPDGHAPVGAAGRGSGPLLTTRTGTRLPQPQSWRTCTGWPNRAGFQHAERLSLHWLRAAFITRDSGGEEADATLEDVRNAASHADPRTTRRYDGARHSPAQPGTARHSPAQPGTARHSPAQPGTARHSPAQPGQQHGSRAVTAWLATDPSSMVRAITEHTLADLLQRIHVSPTRES